jgi:hypothetical protein
MTMEPDEQGEEPEISLDDRAMVISTVEKIARARRLAGAPEARKRFTGFVALTLRRGLRDPDKLFDFCLLAAERRFGGDAREQ